MLDRRVIVELMNRVKYLEDKTGYSLSSVPPKDRDSFIFFTGVEEVADNE